jgi:hypothetical protein
MIDNRDDLEAALQRAVELMAEPPEPGTTEHEEFLVLLAEIEACHDRLQAEANQGPLARERAALADRLAQYGRRYQAQEKLAKDHRHGEGMPPSFAIM